LLILAILSVMLTSCNKSCTLTPPKKEIEVVTKRIKQRIPSALLQVAPAPDAKMLKGVVIMSGEQNATKYLKSLFRAWYINANRIKAIKKVAK